MAANLTSIEEETYQTRNRNGQDPLIVRIKIIYRIAPLNRVVNAGTES